VRRSTCPPLQGMDKLRYLDDLVRFDAVRAHGEMLRLSVDPRPDLLEVRFPAPSCKVVRVADVIAGDRLLSANVADLCHASIQS